MTERAPDFVYPTYIAASAQDVWDALFDRDKTGAYWGHFHVSDWKPGSSWQHVNADGSERVAVLGKVVAIEPPHRLVVTWAFPKDKDDDSEHSEVTCAVDALGPDTRLTVTHRNLKLGSEMHNGVTQGWPAVISNLKTLLETGKTLSDDEWA